MDLRAGGTSLVDRKPDESPTPLKPELLAAGTEARRQILTDYRCSVQSWIDIICSSDNQRLFCLDGVTLKLSIEWLESLCAVAQRFAISVTGLAFVVLLSPWKHL